MELLCYSALAFSILLNIVFAYRLTTTRAVEQPPARLLLEDDLGFGTHDQEAAWLEPTELPVEPHQLRADAVTLWNVAQDCDAPLCIHNAREQAAAVELSSWGDATFDPRRMTLTVHRYHEGERGGVLGATAGVFGSL